MLDLCKSITGFLLIANIYQYVVNHEEYRKYIRLVLGCIVIILLIRPFTDWWNRDSPKLFARYIQEYKESLNQLKQEGIINDDYYEKNIKKATEDKIKTLLIPEFEEMGVDLENVTVVWRDKTEEYMPERIIIWTKQVVPEDMKAALKGIIQEKIGIIRVDFDE